MPTSYLAGNSSMGPPTSARATPRPPPRMSQHASFAELERAGLRLPRSTSIESQEGRSSCRGADGATAQMEQVLCYIRSVTAYGFTVTPCRCADTVIPFDDIMQLHHTDSP